MGQEKREFWSQRIEELIRSGLTVKAYAAQAGVSVNTLSHWKQKLASEAAVGAPETAKAHFVEVVPARRNRPLSGTTGAQTEPFEVVLQGGIRIRVPMRFDAAALGHLMRIVERV